VLVGCLLHKQASVGRCGDDLNYQLHPMLQSDIFVHLRNVFELLPHGVAVLLFKAMCSSIKGDSRTAAGAVHMWDLVSKKNCGKLNAHQGVVTSVCGVAQTGQLLTAGADCEVKYWDC
jgi:WD40 repeat protein